MRCLSATTRGLLLRRMEECVDGDFQTYKAKDGAFLRSHFFGKYPELLELVKDYTDEQLLRLHRGGHDPAKIYNAYKRAMEHKGGPTVILAKTVKGYGMGTSQSRNATHNEKKLTDEGLAAFVKQFDIPIPEQAAKDGSFYRPAAGFAGTGVHAGAAEGTGRVPADAGGACQRVQGTGPGSVSRMDGGSKDRAVSTTMGFVSILRHLMKDPAIGKLIVPIVPDEGQDVWAGVGDQAGWHLCARRTEV